MYTDFKSHSYQYDSLNLTLVYIYEDIIGNIHQRVLVEHQLSQGTYYRWSRSFGSLFSPYSALVKMIIHDAHF